MSSLACGDCLPPAAELARLAENAAAGRREPFVGTGAPGTVLACVHGAWRLGDVLDAAADETGDELPQFEDHSDLKCDCGLPVVRLASTAAGVPGRWRKGCAEHSTGRNGGGGGNVPETAGQDGADGQQSERQDGTPQEREGESGQADGGAGAAG